MQTFLANIKKHFLAVPFLVVFNILTVVMLGGLAVYAKLKKQGDGVERLFSDPFNYWFPYEGILTGISEILWCIPIAICAFTFGALRQRYPRDRSAKFLLFSALVLGIFFFDDRFRLTFILTGMGVSSKLIYLCYGTAVLICGIKFWLFIRTTSYLPLIAGFMLFAVSRVEDLIAQESQGLHAILEDGTKMLALLNIAMYFWHVCDREIWKYFQQSEQP